MRRRICALAKAAQEEVVAGGGVAQQGGALGTAPAAVSHLISIGTPYWTIAKRVVSLWMPSELLRTAATPFSSWLAPPWQRRSSICVNLSMSELPTSHKFPTCVFKQKKKQTRKQTGNQCKEARSASYAHQRSLQSESCGTYHRRTAGCEECANIPLALVLPLRVGSGAVAPHHQRRRARGQARDRVAIAKLLS